MSEIHSHDLFSELSMFCADWQTRFAHVRDAAAAAGCLDLYYGWLNTLSGIEYNRMLRETYDIFIEQQAATRRADSASSYMADAMESAAVPVTAEGDDE